MKYLCNIWRSVHIFDAMERVRVWGTDEDGATTNNQQQQSNIEDASSFIDGHDTGAVEQRGCGGTTNNLQQYYFFNI